jgi:hypothetical protein
MWAKRSVSSLVLLGAFAGALSCRSRAPVAPTPPPPVVVEPPPAPPPPPPPKCESLAENCKAVADTVIGLPDTEVRFAPPEGWGYAREPGFSVAVAPGGTAVLALATAPSDDKAPIFGAIEKLLTRLEIVDVHTKSLRGRLNKPDAELESGPFALRLWEVDKRRQRGKAPQLKGKGQGTLLVAVAPVGKGQVVVGAGFVLTPDSESLASLVMKSIQSLRAAP